MTDPLEDFWMSPVISSEPGILLRVFELPHVEDFEHLKPHRHKTEKLLNSSFKAHKVQKV